MHDPSAHEAPTLGPDGEASGRSGRVTAALLALACLLGLTRFTRLGEWGLWIDEAFTFADALHVTDPVNPLGYGLWRAWLGAVGTLPSEVELRLPAAVFGWLTIPLLYFAGRPLVGGRGAAVASLMLAASSWHLYWSQCARFYTLSMALTLLGAGLALRGVERDRVGLLLVGLALAGLGTGAHPSAAFVLGGLVLGPLLLPRGARLAPGPRVRRVCLALLVLGAIGGGLWASGVLERWSRVKGRPNLSHLVLSSGFYLTPAIAVAALFGAVAALWTGRGADTEPGARNAVADGARVALCVSAIGWGAALAASTQMRMSAQYVFVLLPWALLLAAVPLALERGRMALRGAGALAYGALLVAPLLTDSFLYLTVRNGERPAWREAFSLVLEERRAGDLVMGMAAPVGQFYMAPGSTDLRALGALDYLNSYTWDHVVDAVRTDRRAWFVVQHERFADWPDDGRRDEMRRILREDCRLVAEYPLQVESRDLGVQVYLRE